MNENPEVTAANKARSYEAGKFIGAVLYKGIAALLAVTTADLALLTGWHEHFPLFPAWMLVVVASAGIGHISRKVAHSVTRGKGDGTLENFAAAMTSGLVQVQHNHPPALTPVDAAKAASDKGQGLYM